MANPTTRLGMIQSFEQLLPYLEEELDWPLQQYEFEDLTFEYFPAELGLKEEDAVKVSRIHQLRPLQHGQPWGIFFVEFEKKKLPVVVLRRILSHLVVKKRASANQAGAAAWNLGDLLFISAFGEGVISQREIAFAHFHQETGDLPTLRVLGWDGADTPLKLNHVAATLREKLHWPDNPGDHAAWRETWSQAFRHRLGHIIRTADSLAEALAALARRIRAAALLLLEHESETGTLRTLHKAFQTALIHDLSEENFADTYAQTITYGLLTAAISRTDTSGGSYGTALIAENVADIVPVTNPFLREMLQTFLRVGGRKGGIDFDELGIQDVVELLRGDETDLPAVLRDFGNKTQGEDPVIHFYEHFLAAYDKKLKVQRGVFYTPKPVVSYIVRSVHELLQTEFGLADGLADTTTWGEMLRRQPGLKLPTVKVTKPGTTELVDQPIDPNTPFVQILDPATGTATFLVEVIEVIHRTMTAKWRQAGLNASQQQTAWNEYVPKHLLPRLHGYELMMAPYAIAHMKMGLKLYETGYRFGSQERVRIYLTNALEPANNRLVLAGISLALAHEAQDVNSIKQQKRFTVVIGNPPYSKISSNRSQDAISLVNAFRFVNGQKIVEKGALALELNLQDDYVKFWGLLCTTLHSSHVGIGSYITNSRYLASPSLRGMRWSISDQFSQASFLDLGGQISEKSTDFLIDENVFDIEQGVAIGMVIAQSTGAPLSFVHFERISGTRSDKYRTLAKRSVFDLNNPISLSPPWYRFSRELDDVEKEFNSWVALNELMPFNSGSIITSRDNLAIDFDKKMLLRKILRFANSQPDDKQIEIEIGYFVKPKWKVEACKATIRATPNKEEHIREILYRPFDKRYIYYSTFLLDTPSQPVCSSIFDHENLVLLTPKVKTTEEFSHAFVSREPSEKKAASHDRATQMFPLYQYTNGFLRFQTANFTNLPYDVYSRLQTTNNDPTRFFYYIYTILYSPTYRDVYGNALRDSFPRIPILTPNVKTTKWVK